MFDKMPSEDILGSAAIPSSRPLSSICFFLNSWIVEKRKKRRNQSQSLHYTANNETEREEGKGK